METHCLAPDMPQHGISLYQSHSFYMYTAAFPHFLRRFYLTEKLAHFNMLGFNDRTGIGLFVMTCHWRAGQLRYQIKSKKIIVFRGFFLLPPFFHLEVIPRKKCSSAYPGSFSKRKWQLCMKKHIKANIKSTKLLEPKEDLQWTTELFFTWLNDMTLTQKNYEEVDSLLRNNRYYFQAWIANKNLTQRWSKFWENVFHNPSQHWLQRTILWEYFLTLFFLAWLRQKDWSILEKIFIFVYLFSFLVNKPKLLTTLQAVCTLCLMQASPDLHVVKINVQFQNLPGRIVGSFSLGSHIFPRK